MQASLPVIHAGSTTVCSGNSQKGQLTLGPSFLTTRARMLAEAGLRQRCPVMNCAASASQWASISLMEGKRAGESRNGRTRIKGGFALPCLSQEGLWLCLEPFQPASLRSRSSSLEWAVNWQAGQASWLLRPRGSLWCPLWAAELSRGKRFSPSPFCSFSSLPRD